jgi:RNA polymerase sigma-70 factor (ECF subfamily)
VYRYEGRIYGFLLKSCGNDTDARELAQDTFVRAFQAILQFDLRCDFAPWLFTIARRKLIDHIRAHRPISDEPLPDTPDFFDPAEALAQNEDAQNLWDLARRGLPAIQFQTLWLRYVEDMDVAQIAQVLRLTKTHVKVLLFRARAAMAKPLRALGNPLAMLKPTRALPTSNPPSLIIHTSR